AGAGPAAPPLPGGAGSHSAGQSPADGPQRHDRRAGPPLFAEVQYGQRHKTAPDRPNGTGQRRIGQTKQDETMQSHGGSRGRTAAVFYYRPTAQTHPERGMNHENRRLSAPGTLSSRL